MTVFGTLRLITKSAGVRSAQPRTVAGAGMAEQGVGPTDPGPEGAPIPAMPGDVDQIESDLLWLQGVAPAVPTGPTSAQTVTLRFSAPLDGGTVTNTSVRVFDAETGVQLTTGPIGTGLPPAIDVEAPDASRAIAERVMTGLRLREGIDASDLPDEALAGIDVLLAELPVSGQDQEAFLRGHLLAARRFVHHLEAQVSAVDRIPPEVIQEMKDLGLFGMTIPEEYGGFGLSKAWRIVTNHGGRIEVESEPGEGAAFVVILPRRAQRL